MRFKEGMALKRIRAHVTHAGLTQKRAIFAHIDPKNVAAMGRLQHSIIDDSATVEWVGWFLRGVPMDCKLWSGSPSSYRTWFTAIPHTMDLQHLKLGPGSSNVGHCGSSSGKAIPHLTAYWTSAHLGAGPGSSHLKHFGMISGKTSLHSLGHKSVTHFEVRELVHRHLFVRNPSGRLRFRSSTCRSLDSLEINGFPMGIQ